MSTEFTRENRSWIGEGWRWLDVLNVAVGVWLALSPFVLGGIGADPIPAGYLAFFFGYAIVLFALDSLTRGESWEEWYTITMGGILLGLPFVFSFTETSGGVNFIICGLILVLASFTNLLMEQRDRETGPGSESLPPIKPPGEASRNVQ